MKTTSTNYSTIKYIFGLLIIILSNAIHAQDLIVTKENDSLNCKITKIKTDNIYFTFMHKDEIRSTLLPINQVKFHQYNFYKTSVVPADKVIDTQKYNHFRIAVNGGWSYRVAKIAGNNDPEIQKYQKDLKSGYNLGIDATYFISEPIGIGFKYNNFKSKNEIPSANLFASKKGQFIRIQHSRLKHYFNVTKYTHIKHTEAEQAFNYLKSLSLDMFSPFETRMTPKQLEIIELEKSIA